jgi:hypothetical protein
LVKRYEATLDLIIEAKKHEILNTCKRNMGFGENQIFETFVTFFDDYYVNFMFLVSKCLEIIRENNIPVTKIPINTNMIDYSKLIETKGIEEEYKDDTPIIVLENNITSTPLIVVDGNHRLKRRYKKGYKDIEAYILNKNLLTTISVDSALYNIIQLGITFIDHILSYRIGQVSEDDYDKFESYVNKFLVE